MKTISYSILPALSFCFLLLLNTATIFAQPTQANTTAKALETLNNEQEFDTVVSNKLLNTLKNTGVSGKTPVKNLQDATVALTKLQQQAKKCVDTHTILLDKLNQRLNEITKLNALLKPAKEAASTEEQKYLNRKKNELTGQLSDCRLFSLRAEEITADLNQKLRDLVTTRLLYAHPNLIENIKKIPGNFIKSWQSFDRKTFADDSGLAFFENENTPLLILLLMVILTIFYSNNRLKKRIIPSIADPTKVQIKQIIIAILSRYLPIFSGVLVLTIFFSTFTHSLITPSYFALTCYAFLAYLFYLSLVQFYFYPPLPAEGFTSLPKPIAKKVAKRLVKLGMLSFVTYVICVFFSTQDIDRSVIDLFQALIITLYAISLISLIWAIKNFPALNYQHAALRFLTSFILICFLLLVLITEYLGYHLLAFYLLFSTIMTVIVTFFTRLLGRLLAKTLDAFKGTERPWQQKMRGSFGLKRNERLIELLWLRALLYIVLWLGFLVALLKIWGLAQANFQVFINYLLNGFEVGTLYIAPSRIVKGALFFIILALFTRWFRAYVTKHANWQLEAASRESLASIIGYVGFSVAFILGALIAGVNFSGLAIVAGALAVGIGFGLQNIVNNFVSGIILLVERPVKLGDRIVIGQTEGYVKKISIRSTRITTPACSDVIVPNSELISQQVVNYMLHDLHFKISTTVGIAYGSDTELAKNILLSIAKTHPEVITDRKDLEPVVYFRSFGASSLDFQLLCVVKDVNLRYDVISDLNFAIDKAFREKGIEIAFPQQEVRIKNLPQRVL